MSLRRLLAVAAPLLASAALLVPVASATASTVCVEVVVDYGKLVDGRAPSATCVVVPTGATGAEVMQARAKKLDVDPPRYRADGLLCAIDGVPKTGCAEQTGNGGFKYWSYWHKQLDSAWSYSHSGPFDYGVTGAHPGEGWAWVEGGQEATRRPATVSYSRVCPLTTATPKPKATKTTKSTGGSNSTTSTTSDAPSTTTQSATATASPSRTTQPSTAASQGSPSATPSEVAIADPPRRNDSGGTPVLGLVAGAAIIAGVGGAALWRSRRVDTG
jgi:hypothetical protein